MPGTDQVLTAEQMRAAEIALVARGISVDELMLRAGRGAAEWVWRVAAGRPVTVLCGPGNNGGDGYVIARTLRDRGLEVTLVAPDEPRTAAARNARDRWGGNVVRDGTSASGGVFVDCLFGSGLARPLTPRHEALLSTLSDHNHFTIAIDLPSGVRTDDGALLGVAPPCDLTLALGAWKPGHFLMPALAGLGNSRLIEIGIEAVSGAAQVFPRPRFEVPAHDAHKYTRGLVGVVAGAMAGAALLSASAAMRGGAGYVKLLADHLLQGAAAALVVENAPLGEALADKRFTSLLVGPGLGRDESSRERLGAVLERGVPTVLDADALHLLDDDALEGVDGSRLLLTPHEGELAALCVAFGIAGAGKVERVRELAQTTGLTILAKGPDTVLAAPDGRLAYFPPAPSWLASAGTGDVLAGIAASRLATGQELFEAAGQAVWLHAEAARCAGPDLTADDLVAALPNAYAQFL